MSDHPLLLIVDDSDTPLGSATMQEAHKQGLWHKIASVIIENDTGERI